MDAQDSTVGGLRTVQSPPKLSSPTRELARHAITHLIAATTAVHAATLADTFLPEVTMEELPATRWEPQGVLTEP